MPPCAQDRERTLCVVDNLNVRHRNAQLAGRASVELHTLIFFRGRPTLADARVVKVGRAREGRSNKGGERPPVEQPAWPWSSPRSSSACRHSGSSSPVRALS